MPDENDQSLDRPGTTGEAEKAAARQWFQKAKSLVDTKNYDYAIECYINGLERWPEAVEEGHRPLYFAAMMRAAAGGKKPGTLDTIRRPTSGKDSRKAMLNAEFLMAKDPKNITYLEAAFRNAVKAGFDEAAMWLGQNYADACQVEKKPSAQRYRLLVDLYAEIGDRYTELSKSQRKMAKEATDPDVRKTAAAAWEQTRKRAIEALERAIDAMVRLRQIDTKNLNLSSEQGDLTTRLTIVKGQYDEAESFKDSVRDSTAQARLHDVDRLVQADDRLDDLIAKARAELAESPDVAGKVFGLVDLLCKREKDEFENEAVETLLAAYRRSNNYNFKMRADDIRIRQLNRRAREISARGDRDAARKHIREQLKLELGIFEERVREYPTDLRVRFEYGKRLFKAHLHDRAIPVFQEARNDPKVRTRCGIYIGRCFFEKGYHDQAIDVLTQAIAGYEMQGDEISKDLHYWLGRSHEAAGHVADARKVYGQVLQWDYNYRDVRERMDNLRAQQ